LVLTPRIRHTGRRTDNPGPFARRRRDAPAAVVMISVTSMIRRRSSAACETSAPRSALVFHVLDADELTFPFDRPARFQTLKRMRRSARTPATSGRAISIR
jgi:hypothetical protein